MFDRATKERIAELLANAGEIYWEIDLDYNLSFCNSLFEEFFGPIEGRPCYQLIGSCDDICPGCPASRVFNGENRVRSENLGTDIHGNNIWLETTVTPVRNSDGAVVGARLLSSDITQRKRDEEWLKDSERLYRNLVEQSPDVIFSLDSKACFLFVNPQIEKFLGFPVSQVLETPLRDYVAPEDRSRLDNLSSLETGKVWDEEVAVLDRDGARKVARIRIVKSINEIDQTGGFDGVMRDRTVRRQLEEELKASKAALVEKIKIIDELYEHIVESGKCKAIEDHTAEVAHELRQPLAIIGGFARRLSRAINSPGEDELDKQKQYVSIIITEIQRLEKILDRLIEFTKRSNVRLQRVNPNDLIKYILEITESRVLEKALKIDVNLGSEIGDIPVDPGRFQQLVLNLLSNAIEASPPGGIITIETGVSIPSDKAQKVGELESEVYFEMKMSNTGSVIPPEALQNVFNPFFTTKEHGTGLGLTVTKKIVEDHAGSISLKSDENGTVFRVWLPLDEKEQLGGICYYVPNNKIEGAWPIK